jgi:hypothetical protein
MLGLIRRFFNRNKSNSVENKVKEQNYYENSYKKNISNQDSTVTTLCNTIIELRKEINSLKNKIDSFCLENNKYIKNYKMYYILDNPHICYNWEEICKNEIEQIYSFDIHKYIDYLCLKKNFSEKEYKKILSSYMCIIESIDENEYNFENDLKTFFNLKTKLILEYCKFIYYYIPDSFKYSKDNIIINFKETVYKKIHSITNNIKEEKYNIDEKYIKEWFDFYEEVKDNFKYKMNI